jgi:hypothetical protein
MVQWTYTSWSVVCICTCSLSELGSRETQSSHVSVRAGRGPQISLSCTSRCRRAHSRAAIQTRAYLKSTHTPRLVASTHPTKHIDSVQSNGHTLWWRFHISISLKLWSIILYHATTVRNQYNTQSPLGIKSSCMRVPCSNSLHAHFIQREGLQNHRLPSVAPEDNQDFRDHRRDCSLIRSKDHLLSFLRSGQPRDGSVNIYTCIDYGSLVQKSHDVNSCYWSHRCPYTLFSEFVKFSLVPDLISMIYIYVCQILL